MLKDIQAKDHIHVQCAINDWHQHKPEIFMFVHILEKIRIENLNKEELQENEESLQVRISILLLY